MTFPLLFLAEERLTSCGNHENCLGKSDKPLKKVYINSVLLKKFSASLAFFKVGLTNVTIIS